MSYGPEVTLIGEDGSVNPTLRMSAGAAAVGQTVLPFTGNPSIVAGANIALTTVPAGKTLYITDIYVGSNTNVVFLVQITQGGTPIFQGYCKGDTGPIVLAGIETQPSAPAGAAVALVLGTAAGTTAAYFISGFVQ